MALGSTPKRSAPLAPHGQPTLAIAWLTGKGEGGRSGLSCVWRRAGVQAAEEAAAAAAKAAEENAAKEVCTLLNGAADGGRSGAHRDHA